MTLSDCFVLCQSFKFCWDTMALEDVTSKYANKTIDDRLLIIQTGHRLQGELNAMGANRDVRYSEIARRLKKNYAKNIDRKTITLWWDRRDEMGGPNGLKKRPCAGIHGNTHESFNTAEKRENVIDRCEALEDGFHQPDVAEEYGCSTSTLYRHTSITRHPNDGVNWRIALLSNSEVKEETYQRRESYAHAVYDHRTGRVKRRFGKIAHLDHSWISWYGGNRSHMRQARRRGSRIKLRPKFSRVFKTCPFHE